MKQKLNIAILGFAVAGFSPIAQAVNDAPPDADIVMLRKSCTVGATAIPNCFESMYAVGEWLKTVRHPDAAKPTLVDIGPGKFDGWTCYSSDVTLRGSGRDRTILGIAAEFPAGIFIGDGCTNLSVQDLTVDNSDNSVGDYGVRVINPTAVTTWTNVEIIGANYGWDERPLVPIDCSTIQRGKHLWFSSRIRSVGAIFRSRAYSAQCAQSWFWGSEITTTVNDTSAVLVYAIYAKDAEIHLYGSNVGMTIPVGKNAIGFMGAQNSDFLVAATLGSEIHIHGTGLDVIHKGSGIVDMLYADETSHFHANESGFNIHVDGTGQVRRLAGPGKIQAPYMWGQNTIPPLSANGMQTLISRNGADRYIETDCPLNGKCSSLGGDFPHEMIYHANCTNTDADHGPWFDMTAKACRGE